MKKPKKDNTSKERQARRRSLLDRIARGLGFDNWGKLETEAINGRYILPKREKGSGSL